MSWILENKFIAGLAGVTAVAGGVIFFYGSTQGAAFDEGMGEYTTAKNKHSALLRSRPYPDAVNLKSRQNLIKEYEAIINEIRASFGDYHKGALKPLTPQQFSDIQIKMQSDLIAAFNSAGTTLPDGCGFGFEKYAKIQVKPQATSQLNYQLGAMQWLLGKLAEVKPQAIINIKRGLLDVETGVVAPPSQATPGSRGRGRGASGDDAPVEKLYTLMPMEIAFTADEASLRAFLKEIVNSKQYFYAIRAIRIRSGKQTAPTIKDANFPAGSASKGRVEPPIATEAPNPFFGFDPDEGSDDSEEEIDKPTLPESNPAGERILAQVLGGEKINVYLSLDILLITVPKEKIQDAEKPQ